MTSDYDLYVNKGSKALISAIIFPILASLVAVLRLYTRVRIIRNPALDDLFAIIALLFSILASVCIALLLEVQNGMGRHFKTLPYSSRMRFYKFLYANILIYNFGLLFTKISILFQYLRIATNKKIRLVCYSVMIFTSAYGATALITGIFHCWPISRFWNRRIAGKCVKNPIIWFLHAGLEITTDIILLTLPMFILKAASLPKKQKFILCLTLSLGVIISALRLYSLYLVSVSKDITWDITNMTIWSIIELNVGIICLCVSTLRPLISRLQSFFCRKKVPNSDIRRTSVIVTHGSEANIGSYAVGYKGRPSESMESATNSGPEASDKKELVLNPLPNYPALVYVSTREQC
ncbi:PTH11-like integral membrane protein [Blumeria hordei DH14]|uniref:PTH11-like integral membrane protein n=1 Tax=Blumeria graminis f. sp. hordei (strain DH14) TaxID=546991 RepID=N1JF72_BLUG1|nr:PTH11-like integral membrane protein [Blumeria hordei DH14]